jgi:hypothetical protein
MTGALPQLALWSLMSGLALGAGGDYEPRDIAVRGTFTHPATGFAMPETVGDFKRTAVTQYDEAATDFSAGYNRVDERGALWPIVATLYVYPIRGSADLDERFSAVIDVLKRSHGGVDPAFRENVTLCQGRFEARYAAFGYQQSLLGATRPVRSYLLLYRYLHWWVKWRVTMPVTRDGEPIRAMVALTESLVPPETTCGAIVEPAAGRSPRPARGEP